MILAEVVRRVSGLPLDAFLSEILPGQLKSLRLRLDHESLPLVARIYWLGRKRCRVGSVNIAEGFEERNNALSTLTSLVPGGSMGTTASALALFYEMVLAGGTMADGTRLIGSETLERYIRTNVTGFDRTLRSFLVLGRGFLRGWLWPHPYGWWNTRECFGHGGGYCVVSFGDRLTGAAIAIVTNGNRDLMDVLRRCAPLGSSIRKSFSRPFRASSR